MVTQKNAKKKKGQTRVSSALTLTSVAATKQHGDNNYHKLLITGLGHQTQLHQGAGMVSFLFFWHYVKKTNKKNRKENMNEKN